MRQIAVARRLLSSRCAHDLSAAIMTESPDFERLSENGGWMVDEALFRPLLELEIHKAQRLRYTVSVVCLTMEPSGVGNGPASRTSVAESIAVRLRGTDLVAMWAEGRVLCLLLDAEPAQLPSILERLTTRLQMGSWSAGGSSYPRTAVRAEDMLRQAVDLHARARDEGGNRLYVAS